MRKKNDFFCNSNVYGLFLGDKVRKSNLQSPAIMAGTQNLQNTAQNYQNENNYNDANKESENTEPLVKEDFLKAPNSQSNDKLNSDPFDQDDNGASPSDSPVNQIQNMTREAGDGQNDTSNDNAE